MSKLTQSKAAAAAIAALTLAAGIAGTAYAGSNDDADRRVGEASVSIERDGDSTVLPMEAMLARLRAAGYTEIRKVERERGRYEVEGRDAQGERVELYVDARTGEVLKAERDD